MGWCCNDLSTWLFLNLLQGFINLKSGKSAFYLKKNGIPPGINVCFDFPLTRRLPGGNLQKLLIASRMSMEVNIEVEVAELIS
jgi:hypothetical protein